MSEASLIWSTFADEAAATQAATTLLDEGLIACTNLFPSMHSIFCWRGEMGEGSECGALFKTSHFLVGRALERLEAIHPYDAPSIIAVDADKVGRATAKWLSGMGGEGVT